MMTSNSTETATAHQVQPDGFQLVMKKCFEFHSTLDNLLMDRMFQYFDRNRNGSLSLKELIWGLSDIFRGSTTIQARFYFFIFDVNGDGGLSQDELTSNLSVRYASIQHSDHAAGDTMVDNTALLKASTDLLLKLDADGDGEITEKEMVRAATIYPDILRTFRMCLFGSDSNDEALERIRRRRVKLLDMGRYGASVIEDDQHMDV